MKGGASRAKCLAAVALALVATSLWFRCTSLEAIPSHNADESYEGLQIARMLRGQPFSLRTINKNLIDPFFVAIQVPFQVAFRPSLWVLRVPSVLSGLLAIVLAHRLGRRAMGAAEARSAALFLAAAPAAIVYSRFGFEYAQIPLVGVIAITSAFRGSPMATAAALAAAMLVHPINAFLVPVVASVYLTRLAMVHSVDPARLRAVVIRAGIAVAGGLAIPAAILLARPQVRGVLLARPPLDWLTFLEGFERSLLQRYGDAGASWHPLQRLAFWAVALGLLDVGTRRLIAGRRWDRLALLAGSGASLAAFHLIAGPQALNGAGLGRYGVVFLAPSAIGFACLVVAAFPTAGGSAPARSSAARDLLVMAVAAGLLGAAKANWLDAHASRRDSIWTFRSDVKDPSAQVLSLIMADSDRARKGPPDGPPIRIVAEEYWSSKPLEYLASWDDSVRVEELISPESVWDSSASPSDRFGAARASVVERVAGGAYAVASPWMSPALGGGTVETAIRSAFPPDRVRRWVIADRDHVPSLVIYRLARPEDRANPIAGRATPRPGRR